jgi:hypothetical protein
LEDPLVVLVEDVPDDPPDDPPDDVPDDPPDDVPDEGVEVVPVEPEVVTVGVLLVVVLG